MLMRFKRLFLTLMVILFSVLCSCTNEPNEGVLFNLSDAYYLGKINCDNLLEISEHHENNENCIDILEEKIQIKIKKSYLKASKKEDINIDDVEISKYYGVFNNYYAVILRDRFSDFLPVEMDNYIANIKFHYSNSNSIMVWSETQLNDDERIKLDYLKKYLAMDYPLATINDVIIGKKIGTYNGAQVLFVTNSYDEYATIKTKETILNYVFEYINNNSAKVYFQNCFYTLKEAYSNKILLTEHLDELIKKFPVPSGNGMEINGEPIV